MTIDAQRGAKILSFKYGEQEIISQLRRPEAFGSTFWTSPQKEWYQSTEGVVLAPHSRIRQAALSGRKRRQGAAND